LKHAVMVRAVTFPKHSQHTDPTDQSEHIVLFGRRVFINTRPK